MPTREALFDRTREVTALVFTDGRYARRVAVLATAVFLCCLALGVMSFFPWGWRLYRSQASLLWLAAVLIGFRAHFASLEAYPYTDEDFDEHLPRATRRGVRVLALACPATGTFALFQDPGSPELRSGLYVLNNHGSYTVVSRDRYRKAEAHQVRGFSLVAAALFAGAAISELAVARSQRKRPGE